MRRDEHDQSAGGSALSIVGMSCRFPGAPDLEAFWDMLLAARQAIIPVPEDRWSTADLYDPDPRRPGRMYCRAGGFIDGLCDFDAQVFGISPREARLMDPQHRLFLEEAWRALEDAGLRPDRMNGVRCGVYFGVYASEYALQALRGATDGLSALNMTGASHAAAAGRLSFRLGLSGPSLAVDTACSSSLMALHLARQALLGGDCEVAIVGGANALLLPEVTIGLCRAGMLSPTDTCHTFDAAADGYVRGEGCGAVVLATSEFVQAYDLRPRALLLATAANQDGQSASPTAPNLAAQTAVIGEALQRADVRPEDIGYLEAHGTGTRLGDPIEVRAAAAAFQRTAREAPPLLVGSVKSNIGHLEAAAGIAGLIKSVLVVEHGAIPAHVGLESPNPLIDWETLSVVTPNDVTPIPAPSGRRIAGVSAFGMSGTNVHAIVASSPPPIEPETEAEPEISLLCVSAYSPGALRALAAETGERLEISGLGLCASAARHRAALPFRAYAVGRSATDIAARLQESAAVATPARRAPDLALGFGEEAGDAPTSPALARWLWGLGVRPAVIGGAGPGATRARRFAAWASRRGGTFQTVAAPPGTAAYVDAERATCPAEGSDLETMLLGLLDGDRQKRRTIYLELQAGAPCNKADRLDAWLAGQEARLYHLGELWRAGAALDLSALFPPGRNRARELPLYPFDRQRYAHDQGETAQP